MNDVLTSKDFSTQVHSDKPIIAERAMYWGEGEETPQGEAMPRLNRHVHVAQDVLPAGRADLGREGDLDTGTEPQRGSRPGGSLLPHAHGNGQRGQDRNRTGQLQKDLQHGGALGHHRKGCLSWMPSILAIRCRTNDMYFALYNLDNSGRAKLRLTNI